MFKRIEAGLVLARKELSKALAVNLEAGGDPVTATRIWFEAPSIEQRSTETQPVDVTPLADDDNAPGFLELLAEMEDGTQSLGQTMVAATTIIEEISAIYTETTDSIRKADARGGGASGRLAIAELTATKLAEKAARLEVVSGEFARTVDRIEPGIKYLLGRLAEEPDQLTAVPNFPAQIKSLCDAAQSTIEGSNAMRLNALEIGKASRSLRRASERLVPSFKRFSDTSSRIADWSKLLDKFPYFSLVAQDKQTGAE